jgi:hypothetical protein
MSSFVWIDHSEKQRRQVMDAIDLFREKDTRDELGIAIVRDAISDALFPGTGSLQTRARYFFFVPWMYRKLEQEGATESDVARKGREIELALIDTLAEHAGPGAGVIGIMARRTLQRTPASVYWNGLRTLGIMSQDWSHVEYHRSLSSKRRAERDDDGNPLDANSRAWHGGLPNAPKAFPLSVDLALLGPEADYLKERVVESHRSSLLAFLLLRGPELSDAAFAWEHPACHALPPSLARQVAHARLFSESMYGAAILYNLWLAEMEPKRPHIVDECRDLLAEWSAGVEAIRGDLSAWSLDDFWLFIRSSGAKPSEMSRIFVERWIAYVRKTADLEGLVDDRDARELIATREQAIKGALARFSNARSREVWQGAAGLGRMDFRWSNAQVILNDIGDGMRGVDA